MGILHVETVSFAWAMTFRQLVIPGAIFPMTGAPFDMARNNIAQAFLNSSFEWLGYLDSDVRPKPDAFLRLMAHRKPIVSGVYHRRSPPHGVPVAQKAYPNLGLPRTWIQHLPNQGTMEVDVCGAGLMVVHRSVIEAVAKNPIHPTKKWFFWGVDQQGLVPPEYGQSEDFSFNSHCWKMGIPTLVDCSVRAKHTGLADFDSDGAKPVELQV